MHRVSTGNAGLFGAARRHAAECVVAVALSSVIGLVAVAGPAAARTRLGHGGVAYGSSVSLGSVFSSGPTALTTLGCLTRSGVDHTSSAASGGLLAAGTVGEIDDELSTTSHSTDGRSSIQDVALFSNLITASAVTATGSATTDGSSFSTSGDTTVADLVINGTPEPAPVPNTVIPLPSLGTVTLNEQISHVSNKSASIVVNAVHVHIAVTNAFGFPVGTDIVVGHVKVSLENVTSVLVDGKAYGTSVNGVGASSGPSALVHVPCTGTNGNVRTNSTASTTIPDVLSTGTTKSTATATASKSSANVITTETLQNVSLINIVSVDEVKAQANASAVGKDRTFNDTGSSFTNISVLGIPTLPDPVPPNSQFAIPNVGTLYLHRVIQNGKHIEVRMIELVISVPVGPLAVGTDIRIGVADASVH